jgi:hypothetical protein
MYTLRRNALCSPLDSPLRLLRERSSRELSSDWNLACVIRESRVQFSPSLLTLRKTSKWLLYMVAVQMIDYVSSSLLVSSCVTPTAHEYTSVFRPSKKPYREQLDTNVSNQSPKERRVLPSASRLPHTMIQLTIPKSSSNQVYL